MRKSRSPPSRPWHAIGSAIRRRRAPIPTVNSFRPMTTRQRAAGMWTVANVLASSARLVPGEDATLQQQLTSVLRTPIFVRTSSKTSIAEFLNISSLLWPLMHHCLSHVRRRLEKAKRPAAQRMQHAFLTSLVVTEAGGGRANCCNSKDGRICREQRCHRTLVDCKMRESEQEVNRILALSAKCGCRKTHGNRLRQRRN
ncbi:hypothetical protein HPB50_026503 [Hyalomma asiaticum]|uniref:Uncharacterized protein n=1 Tax=Hyalomma asiaticum TaxID=266040 RepID=A0ACB7SU18_HYAAI|nr:hypothetical protein HPB50_026503 [Hyalomma asiaticum]